MLESLEFSTKADSSNSIQCAVMDVKGFSFRVVTLFVNFLYRGKVDCDDMSIRLELARMGQCNAVSLLQKLMLHEMEIDWTDEEGTPPSVDEFYTTNFDLATLWRDIVSYSRHHCYLKVVGFRAQDFLVCSDSWPVSKRSPLLFAIDRVYDNNPNHTFAMLQNATQEAQEILYVMRQMPYDQIRLIDNAALAQQVGPANLWQLAFSDRRENKTSSTDRMPWSEVVSWIIACRYSVPAGPCVKFLCGMFCNDCFATVCQT